MRAILADGFLPCALEMADAFTLAAAQKRTGSKLLSGCHAHLIVELDGQPAAVRSDLKQVSARVSDFAPFFITRALGANACEKIWQLRREFSYALRDTGLTKLNEDIVVPRGKLEDLFRFAVSLQKKHGLPVACFGHAGDGNIHVNVMVNLDDPGASARADQALDDLFRQVLAWGGVITGEHGIGLAKKKWWPQAANPQAQYLHETLKNALDPAGILNPGKFL
jgi:glycolate oxidase